MSEVKGILLCINLNINTNNAVNMEDDIVNRADNVSSKGKNKGIKRKNHTNTNAGTSTSSSLSEKEITAINKLFRDIQHNRTAGLTMCQEMDRIIHPRLELLLYKLYGRSSLTNEQLTIEAKSLIENYKSKTNKFLPYENELQKSFKVMIFQSLTKLKGKI